MRRFPGGLRILPIVGSRYPKSAVCLEVLFEGGLDPNSADWLGKTWLHFAADQGDIDTARVFLEHGANVNAVEEEYRSTPLAEAAKKRHSEMVEFLIAQGADVNAPREPWARPLAWAINSGHVEVAAILRRHGADRT